MISEVFFVETNPQLGFMVADYNFVKCIKLYKMRIDRYGEQHLMGGNVCHCKCINRILYLELKIFGLLFSNGFIMIRVRMEIILISSLPYNRIANVPFVCYI